MSQTHEKSVEDTLERPHGLDRRIDLTRFDPQLALFALFVVLAAVLRFSHLGARAMHHDEAIHAWYSWRFYTGQELYRYNPVFHGPFLYHITAFFYFLFGVSEAIARAPEALFGVLLVVLCYPLRRYLGRYGWLIAAGLLALSPSFVYFSRFARHDAFVATLTLAVVVFLFRYLEAHRARDLFWAAAALALSFATMEVTFITAFILLVFLALAYVLDRQGERFRREARVVAFVVLAVAWLLELRLVAAGGGAPAVHVVLAALALLALAYVGPSSLCARPFPRGTSPVRKAVEALAEQPRVMLGALGIFVLVFGLFYTTFLTNPRGFVDGLVQGLQHWAAQQNVRRGDQPWFYYLLLLVLYEPVTLTAGLAGATIVVSRLRRPTPRAETIAGPAAILFQSFVVHWALFALVLFSWAGEKMPWLVLHVALPFVFLAAIALDRFLAWIAWRPLWRSGDWAVGPLLVLILFALRGMGNALLRMQPGAGGSLEDQYLVLQAAVLGLILVAMIAALTWKVYRAEGRHLGQSLALVGFLLLALYTVRSTFLTNYYHGDVPVEMLVYTQTAPDVPWVVRQIERISIDHTRKVRTERDPTGGHGLQIAIDTSQGLEWPFNWYLREFPLLYFDGSYSPPPDADVVLVLAENEPALRPYLQNAYTGWRYKHRWWFPEFETYKRWRLWAVGVTELGYPTEPWLRLSTYRAEGLSNLWQYLTKRKLPYTLGSQDFYLYVRNELIPGATAAQAAPDPYLEKLAPRQAIAFFGSAGSGPGQLSFPRGIAVDGAGNLYVADSGNHRIVRFDLQGQPSTWGSACVLEIGLGCLDPDGAGPLPLGAGQFNEPWGIAVDSEGRVYVADTWNHRIQVLDGNGNFLGAWGEGRLIDVGADAALREARPFGFYGPRGIAVDREGNVYVTDTGNERVLVYRVESNGAGGIRAEYLYQWGTTGSAPGQFLEPVGIAVDSSGQVYVADTWNLRVQVFAPGPDGKVSSTPVAVIPVTGWESDSRENKPYIAVDPGGQIYFTVPERNYVAMVRLTGEVLAVWGGYGTDLASFHLPTGIAVDASGQVYVSDAGNGRVLLFRLP